MEQWKRGTKERSRRYVSEAYVQTLAAAAGISIDHGISFLSFGMGHVHIFLFLHHCA